MQADRFAWHKDMETDDQLQLKLQKRMWSQPVIAGRLGKAVNIQILKRNESENIDKQRVPYESTCIAVD